MALSWPRLKAPLYLQQVQHSQSTSSKSARTSIVLNDEQNISKLPVTAVSCRNISSRLSIWFSLYGTDPVIRGLFSRHMCCRKLRPDNSSGMGPCRLLLAEMDRGEREREEHEMLETRSIQKLINHSKQGKT